LEVEVQPPPYPEYYEQATLPTRDYRVVFWEHQLPPEGSGLAPEEMGWSELTLDLTDVQDVHEAIAWAESNLEAELDKDGPDPHGERVYVLYAKAPQPDEDGNDWFVWIAGWDPTRVGDNLDRRRPS
jgi:hypothetical protein